jgi:hypothetical protein
MHARTSLLFPLPLAFVLGCPNVWPDFVTCEEADACETTGPSSSTGGEAPTTSDAVQTVTGDSSGGSSTAPDAETGLGSSGATTGEPAEPPKILGREVKPDYTDVNAVLEVVVTADHSDGVQMQLDNGEVIELTPLGPGKFGGQIPAFTGLDNGQHTAFLTPWRDAIQGETLGVDYVIALPPPGYEVSWETGDVDGHVVALGVLPDGRPFEFGTYYEMGEPRCYLRAHAKTGEPEEIVPLLPSAHCSAIDATIDRDTGEIHVLVERLSGQGLRWWAGWIPAWGLGPVNIGIGELEHKAFALASRPGLVAVCGSKPVATPDGLDALAVLLRPNEPPEERLFDLELSFKHWFAETARDCIFADETLVLVGEAYGKHETDVDDPRDRLVVIEHDVDANTSEWIVAGPGPGVQSRGLAIDVDNEGHYHVAGYTCLDDCEPEGEIRVYSPGGQLDSQIPLGPLGSGWFGPHDIAWSPAGYAVVALGELQGQSYVFKVQAFAPNVYEPLWTFIPNNKQGLQIAFAVAVGPNGEVYGGGIGATNHPAFAVIGG